jgi:spore coat protein U-like protein
MKMKTAAAKYQTRMRLSQLTALFLLLLACGTSQAVNCRITVTPLDFGVYNPGATAPLDITGNLDVRCNGSAGSFILTLSPGGSGTYFPRQLASAPYAMQYNLYVDAARSLVWGDGTGGTSLNSGSKPTTGPPVNLSFPIYGRIFPAQSVGPGLYTDSLLVTAVF